MLLCIDDVGKHYPSQASVIKTGLNHAEDGDRKIATIERKDKTIKTPSRDEVIRPNLRHLSLRHHLKPTMAPQLKNLSGEKDRQICRDHREQRGSGEVRICALMQKMCTV